MDVVIKKSKIDNRGVFTKRDFKKGEIVLKWNPKKLTKLEASKLTTKQKHYLYQEKNNYFLMQTPEKYVNHSCDANTTPKNQYDVAIRNIKNGEEITSNYDKGVSHISFKCRCRAKNCKRNVNKA